ncbi:AraC family transcriptional regulator [Saccharibacillus deserti]|uniref:AraC family transcriptional regulator n=1 Tax=Saccharibacillus deserti TaxID=1634444 RepID=UPI00155383F6|nr:AraC family transcriptional regulator [Saccharibacillus deserti]
MKLNEHIHWRNKAHFDLDEDRYETWTLFAVEEGTFRFEVELPLEEPGTPEKPERETALPGFSEAAPNSGPQQASGGRTPAADASRPAAGFPEAAKLRAASRCAPALPLAGEAGFGSAVLCPPGGRLRRQTVTPLTFHYVQFEWSEEQDGPCPWVPGLLAFEDLRRLRSNYAHLRGAESDASSAGRSWTLHLALDLLRLHQTERRRDLRPGARFTEDALMARAAAEIEARFGAPLPLEALAAELGLGPVQFTRRFRAAFGETPSRFLKSLRLARARRLLGDTELTLSDIAERCGYENGFYLSRVFAAETGVSPSEYRRRRRI